MSEQSLEERQAEMRERMKQRPARIGSDAHLITAEKPEIRRRIGFVSEDKALYPYMTVEQMIRFTRPFFPNWRDDLEARNLEMFSLPLKKKVRCRRAWHRSSCSCSRLCAVPNF